MVARGRRQGMRPGIIFGVPRSGTSWLGQIINSSPDVLYRFQPLHSYSYPGRLTVDDSANRVIEFFDDLAEATDPFVLQEVGYTSGGNTAPRFPKYGRPRHVVFKEVHNLPEICHAVHVQERVRLLAIVRDPVDVLESWVNNPKEFHSSWDIADEWYGAPTKNAEYSGNMFGLSKWIQATRALADLESQRPERVLMIHYEDLAQQPQAMVADIFDFLEIPITAQTEDFVKESMSRDDPNPYSVFRTPRRARGSARRLPLEVVDEVRAEVLKRGLGQHLRR